MEYKGELKGFPEEVVEQMMVEQLIQKNKADYTIFEKEIADKDHGFSWDKTIRGYNFWLEVTTNKNFDLFFKHYPKKSKPWEKYKEGDLVVVTYFDNETEWSNHWFKPKEVLKLGGEYWQGSLENSFDAFSLSRLKGGGMSYNFEKNYKLRHATKAEIAKSQWAEADVFPENWMVKGTKNQSSLRKLLEKSHWFYNINKYKPGVSFYKIGLYNDTGYIGHTGAIERFKKDGYTLVTKEQLINHYKLNNTKNEVQSKSKQNRSSTIKGRARISSRRCQGTAGSRPEGNKQTASAGQTYVRSVKIINRVVIRSNP